MTPRTTPTPEVTPQGSAASGYSPIEGAALPPGLAWWSYRTTKRGWTAHVIREETSRTICSSRGWPIETPAWTQGRVVNSYRCGQCLLNLNKIKFKPVPLPPPNPLAPRQVPGLRVTLKYDGRQWQAWIDDTVVGRKAGPRGWKVLEQDMQRLAEYHKEW